MEQVPVATRNGGVTQLDGSVLGGLALRGPLLRPNDDGYDRARSIWNAMIDRCPGLIVRCAGVADVRRAVNLAREHDLLVSVRGGGHGVAGHAVADRGLMIDLSAMTSVRVDPIRRRARVEPGAKLRDFDHEAQAFGLATPLGVISDTGVGGLTLGGGFGLLSRKHGLAIDNLISADVVTADGELLHASEEENPDLFWAIRGGGGNFGVVTSFEFQLHPVGPRVLGGLVAFPLEQAREVMERLASFVEEIPDDLSVQQTIVGFPTPPLPFLPEEVHGQKTVAMVVVWTGDDEEQGLAEIEPILSFGDLLGKMVGPIPYTEFQQMGDPVMTTPARNYWKSQYLSKLTQGAIDVIAEYGMRCPSQASAIILHQQGGRVARVPTHETAYPHREAQFEVNVQGRWQRAADDERVIDWARGIHRALGPFASGSYVNADVGHEGTGDEANHALAAFGPNYARLVEVKRRYDPDNLFRMNANVEPGAGASR